MKNQSSKKIIILLVGISFIFAAFPVYGDTKTDTYETPLPTLAESLPTSVTEFTDCNFSIVSSDYKGIAYLWNQTLSEYN